MTPHPRPRPRPRPQVRSLAVLTSLVGLTLAALLAGCSSAGSSEDSAASAPDAGGAAAGSEAGSGSSLASGDESAPRQVADAALAPSVQSVISTGTVSLRAQDVTDLLADVQQAVDQARGEVTERSSATDDDGAVVRSRLVVRVPAAAFGDLMGALEGTGTLVSSDSTSEDVTAQVIDTRVRVAAQRASITRVQALLEQATDLDDVVAIEAQLTERQAALDSLEQTQAYLADQTTRSTITVSLERSDAPAEPVADDDASGFLAGLSSGWHALAVAGGGLATVAGALLPWLVVALLVGAPLTLVARRLRRRTPGGAAPTP